MRHSTKGMLVCLAVIFALVFSGPKAFAGGGAEGGAGEPPKGLAIQSDAAGQKLVGKLFVELYNYQRISGDYYAEVLRVVVALGSGKTSGLKSGAGWKTFFIDLIALMGHLRLRAHLANLP